MHILIATTSQQLIQQIQTTFQASGITITLVETVQRAAQLLKSSPGIDLLVLDLSIQHAMNFLKEMKGHAKFSSVCVVVVTDDPDPECIKPALEAGAERWLTTAFIRTRLMSVVRSLMVVNNGQRQASG